MTVAAHEVMVYVCVEYTVLVVNCETDAALTDVALETGNTVVATGTSVDVLLPTGQLATSGAHDVIVYTCIEKMVTVVSCTSPLAAAVVPARLAEVITLPELAPSTGEEAVKLSLAWEPEPAPPLGIETELEPAVGSNPEPVEPLEGLVTGTKVGDGTLLSFSSSQISSFSSPSSSSSSQYSLSSSSSSSSSSSQYSSSSLLSLPIGFVELRWPEGLGRDATLEVTAVELKGSSTEDVEEPDVEVGAFEFAGARRVLEVADGDEEETTREEVETSVEEVTHTEDVDKRVDADDVEEACKLILEFGNDTWKKLTASWSW